MTNTEKLIKVIEERREDIIDMSKDIYRKTMDCSYFQGMNVGIIANIDGTLQDFAWTQGTSNFAIHDGEAVIVANWTVTNELGQVFYECDDLTEQEQEDFKKFLLDNEYIEDVEEWGDELNYNRLDEFNPEIVKRIDEEQLEALVDNYYMESASEKIDYTLDNLNIMLDDEE